MLSFLDQAEDKVLETQVCVVGAGPAGITLALELADRGVPVVLLEAGGLAPPGPGELDLHGGEVAGRKYALSGSRLRYFGGTTGHWGGWSRPLDQVDFTAKTHIPYSGWPIDRETLMPWYQQAHRWLEITDQEYFLDREPPFADRLLPSTHGITTRYFRFSPPTRYGARYRDEVKQAKDLTCLLGANVIGLTRSGEHRIAGVRARSLGGREIEIRAGATVLAMGGIENARFMLNSAEQREQAVGNHSDWLGRGFMDHPGWAVGTVISQAKLAYNRFDYEGVPVMPVLGITDEVLLRERIINCCAILRPISFDQDVESAYFGNPWFSPLGEDSKVTNYRMQLIFEPSPCRESRIQLTRQRDSLGLHRPRLHWALNDYDFDMLARTIDLLIAYFGQTGLGRLKLLKPVDKTNIAGDISTGMHHMGTTRMSADPDNGVVDADCKVYGKDNLYIAGSSVFPTAGFSNPTLTIVALACRLADHLYREPPRP
jgi:choline dehydrogenase-like flavoprotein